MRHLHLDFALATIAELGSVEIDLGALPGVCDHVPYVLDPAVLSAVAAAVERSGLRVRSINGDIGHLNQPLDPEARAARDRPLDMLGALAMATGSAALVLHCGALDHTPGAVLDADLDLVAAELIAAAEAADHRGVEFVARVAALPTVVLELPTGSAVRASPVSLPAQETSGVPA